MSRAIAEIWTNKREPDFPVGIDDPIIKRARFIQSTPPSPPFTPPITPKETMKSFKVAVWISASSLVGTTTAGAGDANKLPERAESTTNKVNYDYIAFDTATEENAFFQYKLPIGWDEGKLTFRVLWTNTAGLTTETVVFGLKAQPLSDNDTIDTAWGTEITVTDTWQAQNKVHISPLSTDVTIGAGANGTAVEGDIVMFNIARKTGSDNLTGDARLLGIEIIYQRTTPTD